MLPPDKPPASICILRLSALGDVTHVVPVVRAIRNHWPDTAITWIIGKHEHGLVAGMDELEFLPFDKRAGWAEVRRLRAQLRHREFDVLLHMQVALRANLLSLLVKAPIRLGWDKPRSQDRHTWFINHSIRSVPHQHQVEGFLEFARALGVPVSHPVWQLPVREDDRAWATRVVAGDRPVLMICPCSSQLVRNWRTRRYAEVADHAVSELGMRVVLCGGPSRLEAQTGSDIEAAMKHPCSNLIGKDTLGRFMALLERATVLISPDSGPAHIASALGTPVIGLYAATWSRRTGPYNSLDWCIDKFPEATRRYRDKAPNELRWGTHLHAADVMDLITVDEVIDRLSSFMTTLSSSSRPGMPGVESQRTQ